MTSSRAQARGADNLIERMVRRNIWKPLHVGVYVDHTGPPDEEQLRMGAVLNAWPAALAGESALVAHGVRNVAEDEIRVAVDRGRNLLGHEFAADQWADLARDLLAATKDLITTRLGWGAVAQPCRLARMVGQLLQARGWDGQVVECPDCRGISGVPPAHKAGGSTTVDVRGGWSRLIDH